MLRTCATNLCISLSAGSLASFSWLMQWKTITWLCAYRPKRVTHLLRQPAAADLSALVAYKDAAKVSCVLSKPASLASESGKSSLFLACSSKLVFSRSIWVLAKASWRVPSSDLVLLKPTMMLSRCFSAADSFLSRSWVQA